jgi:hypothetical protein
MSAKQGISRINFVMGILGWMWFIGCAIEMLVIDASLISEGLLSKELSWEVFRLLLPSWKWLGIGFAGLLFSNVLIWILQGFVDD